MGVFQIKNKVNGYQFIGSSTDLKATWNAQKFQLNAGIHRNKELQKDWNEYGGGNFAFEILQELKLTENDSADRRREVKTLEDQCVLEWQPFYNQVL